MDRIEVMLEPLRVFLTQVADFLPRLALALVILIAGWLVAKMVRFAIAKGLRKVNFHVVTERAAGAQRRKRTPPAATTAAPNGIGWPASSAFGEMLI